MEVKVWPKKEPDATKAMVSVTLEVEGEKAYLTGMALRDDGKGLWLTFPSRKLSKPDKEGKNYKDIFFTTKGLRQKIQDEAIAQFNGGGGGNQDIPF